MQYAKLKDAKCDIKNIKCGTSLYFENMFELK